MPSSNDETLNQEDTPDEVKESKPSSRKKKQKKVAKSKTIDDYKDSSSDGPKLSPDLCVNARPCICIVMTHADILRQHRAPFIQHTSPSPPPSPPIDPSARPDLDDQDPALDPLDNSPSPFRSLANQQSDANVHSIRVLSEPSPPQDDLIAGQNGVKIRSPLPLNDNTVQNVASLSSSPQGGIRLPNTGHFRTQASSPPVNRAMPLRERNPSISSPGARLPSSYEPPPPHMPQRHLLRLPELDSAMTRGSDKTIIAGTRGFFCGFDSLESSNAGSSATANNVVLLGWEGGMDVYRLLRHRSDIVGRLEGLRGSVFDAKILPWTDRDDPLRLLRPLVVCTIHGPVSPSTNDSVDAYGVPDIEAPANPPGQDFQTSVEVYSLSSSRHVATLFQSPIASSQHPVAHPLYKPPPPVGNLSIAAEGRFITVTSGKSGEIFVFSPYSRLPSQDQPFRCIGKFWTCVRNRLPKPEGDSNLSGENVSYNSSERKVPFMALSQRWLAIKPPALSSSQITLQGVPTLSERNPEPPGVLSHASPPAPLLNCEVDAPLNNSLLNRVTRQATQEIRKGAQWVGEQGMQAWRSYWTRPNFVNGGNTQQDSATPSRNEQMLFPPTHGHNNEPQQTTIEPAQVSIVDLHKLIDYEDNRNKGASAPLVTFNLIDGCSFLSFAPNGLSLLVTNHVGDASSIWDLTRITDGRVQMRSSNPVAGAVRLSARFARLSPSVVIHVAWSTQGNRIAILTERGTVHLHELPQPDYSPLPYSSPKVLAQTHSGLPSPSSSPQEDTPSSGLINNVRAGWQSIHGLAARSRSGSQGLGLPTLSTLGNASAAARYAGGRAVRHGFSRGFGMAAESAHQIRHAEDNKIRLRPTRHIVAARSVKWLGGRDRELIATVADGKITLCFVRSGFHMQGKRTVASLAAGKKAVAEFTLQPIDSDTMVSMGAGLLDREGPQAACSKEGPHGFWMLNRSNGVRRASTLGEQKSAATITQDKETSPPYMPFHRFPQVNLFTFAEQGASNGSVPRKKAESGPSSSQGAGCDEAWVFGLSLRPVTRINCQQFTLEDDFGEDITDGDIQGLMGHTGNMDLTRRAKSHEDDQVDLFEM